VKRLRVLFQRQQQQQHADSFSAWLRRYVREVRGLAIAGKQAAPVLRTLAGCVKSSTSSSSSRPGTSAEVPAGPSIQGVATASDTAGEPLRLERLVVTGTLVTAEVCRDALQPLLAALPHLRHLHLALLLRVEQFKHEHFERASQAVLAALAPLQHSTSLTSLVLDGPRSTYELGGIPSPTQQQQILAQLPASLCSLTWRLVGCFDLGHWAFDHLPALRRLCVKRTELPDMVPHVITSLPKECQLALPVIPWVNLGADFDNEGAMHYPGGPVALYKEQLVALGLDRCWLEEDEKMVLQGYESNTTDSEDEQEAEAEEAPASQRLLPQLTALQSLVTKTRWRKHTKALLCQAPPLQELRVTLPLGHTPWDDEDWDGDSPLWYEDSPLSYEGSPLSQDALPVGRPSVLRHYNHLSQLQRLKLTELNAYFECPQELGGLTQLQQLGVKFRCYDRQQPDPTTWAHAVAGLVNLQVLRVPAELTTAGPPRWLTGLTRLEVLEVDARPAAQFDQGSAAAHVSSLLVPPPRAATSAAPAAEALAAALATAPAAASTAASAPALQPRSGAVLLVCFWDQEARDQQATQLHRAVAAAVPVLPAGKHLFLGPWKRLKEYGVELWPAPVAARLQQLL
jgi:hypothetical protein